MSSDLGDDGQEVRSTKARSLTTAVSSSVQQTEASGKSNNPSFHAINIGNYCHFCCEHIQQPYCHECVNCGGIMCQQSILWGSNCLCYRMVDTTKDFCCPICARTAANKDAPLSYTILAYWIWKKVKMTWPMVIVSLSLESLKDNYLASTVRCEVEYHYRDKVIARTCLSKTCTCMGGAHVSQSRKLAEGVSFMKCNIEAGFPPNTFVIVDTHSDEYSGMLQHTGGHTGGTNTTITEIVTAYLGEEFLKGTANTSLAARSDKTVVTTKTGQEPWCKLTPNARGGRRVLMLVSCGPAIRVHHHFESMVELVDKDMFDFVLGFGGSGMLPSFISIIVRSLIVKCGVFRATDVWVLFCDLIAANQGIFDYTTTVLVYATTTKGKKNVECRQIVKNSPGRRVFGAEYRSCGTAGCNLSATNIHVYNCSTGRPKVSLLCLKCSWTFMWVRTDEDNEHFKRVHPVLVPQVFWHHFLPSTGLQNFFEGKGKGGKGNGKKRCHTVMDEHMMKDEVDPITMDINAMLKLATLHMAVKAHTG
ncbi:uncharacterized protein EDB91DRAFT_1255428 [Suillus paluster]|uniref:uncharacterized protein n=1 Tax=Suillus paluster TaxID=48578 RepID=UPI001B8838E7|nr:uncharacterized protein EDB91DRAFT_1255428 [Suillus paluster]KAG1724057.1 hypothetical protein EDB91DRAFT_1255428 [Suillus paluster]